MKKQTAVAVETKTGVRQVAESTLLLLGGGLVVGTALMFIFGWQ